MIQQGDSFRGTEARRKDDVSGACISLGEFRNVYRILVWQSQVKRSLGKLRSTSDDLGKTRR
jgi:hypothetical protein